MKIDIYAMLKTLHFTLQNGKSLSSGIALLAQSTTNKKEQKCYLSIHEDLKGGTLFSDSLRKNRIGSSDVLHFIAMAEKGVSFRHALEKIINFLEIKATYERESNEKTNTPILYLFLSALVVMGVKFFAIPHQIQEAQNYSKEVFSLIESHLSFALLMSETLFLLLLLLIFYFFILMLSLFNNTYFLQNIAKNIAMHLPFASKIVLGFEKFMLFLMISQMLQSGITIKKALSASMATISVLKFKKAIKEMLSSMKNEGKFLYHPSLFDPLERNLLIGAKTSPQIGSVLFEISLRAKEEALTQSKKFFRLITALSIFFMAFAVFIEFYTVVLTQIIIQKGLIDMAKGSGTF